MKSIYYSIQNCIKGTIGPSVRRLLAPSHELAIPRDLWARLMRDLETRGGHHRESGAFLLGKIKNRTRVIESYLLHDDLESTALDSGIIGLTSKGFRNLANQASRLGLDVLGDIHTHPGEAFFSVTDRENPLVPIAGHLALVVPRYAVNMPHVSQCAMYRFVGRKEWDDLTTRGRDTNVYVGFWS